VARFDGDILPMREPRATRGPRGAIVHVVGASTERAPGLSDATDGGASRGRDPSHDGGRARYDPIVASRQIEGRPERPPVLRRALAGVVLLVVAAAVVVVVVHVIMAIFWILVAVAAVAAVLWALNTLL
jgi:hypothetical protein